MTTRVLQMYHSADPLVKYFGFFFSLKSYAKLFFMKHKGEWTDTRMREGVTVTVVTDFYL